MKGTDEIEEVGRMDFERFSWYLTNEVRKFQNKSMKCRFGFEQDRNVRYKTVFFFEHYSGKYPKGVYRVSIPMKSDFFLQWNFLEMLKNVRTGRNILSDFDDTFVTTKKRKVVKNHQMNLLEYLTEETSEVES